jgi:hypothetical protein
MRSIVEVLKREEFRPKTKAAEVLKGVWQTAAFSLSATSPQRET